MESGMRRLWFAAMMGVLLLAAGAASARVEIQTYDLPDGARPHDVAVGSDDIVWYTAQGAGALGRLEPGSGKVSHIPLGEGSAPHGVIVGPDGAPWITDSGLNAILRVDPASWAVRRFPTTGRAHD